jgi:hypothetical protein
MGWDGNGILISKNMTTVLLRFLHPYLLMQLGITYSLQQALEGLGINKTQFEPWRDGNGSIVGSMLNVDATLALPLLAVLTFSLVWFALVMMALRALWGRRAVGLGLLLLLTPGLLSMAGVWPEVQWLPRTYVIGSGYVGSPWGMLLLQVSAMTTGWALTVLITCRLRLDDRFRHGYDQFWYALAISAGLFFVLDLNANGQRDDLRQSAATSRAASTYLLDQVRRLDEACQSGAIKLQLACEWARSSQWQLDGYAHYGEKLYWQLGPEQEWRIYTWSDRVHDDKTVDALRQELHQYNLHECPVTDLGGGVTQSSRISRICQIPPAEFCTSFPSRKLAGVDPVEAAARTVAIANECIVPTLFRLKTEQASLATSVDDNARARHLRTMFFLFVSLVAGGKVANASVRMTEAIRKARAASPIAADTSSENSKFSRSVASLMSFFRGAWTSLVRRLTRR